MIKSTILNHGLPYILRLHSGKVSLLENGFFGLKEYIESAFDGCHEDIFKEGPRSSSLKFNLNIKTVEVKGHEMCIWAEKGLENYKHVKTAHEKVQLCLLENDSKTFAIEVPIWLKEADILKESIKMNRGISNRIFNNGNILTGHIDILSIDGQQIWVWDYKPNAHKEKYASTQVFFYALMLSKRSGIPLKYFRCGYFDDKVAYLFKPDLAVLTAQTSLSA